MYKLNVSVQVLPRPSEISNEELNSLFAGELAKFENWFSQLQAKHGAPGQRLLSNEHAILRSFMFYLYGSSPGVQAPEIKETSNDGTQA